MLKEWQFNILFFVGVGGAVFLLIGPEFGLNIADNPTALAGVGSILTYILTQKKSLTKKDEDAPPKKKRRIRLVEEVHDDDEDENNEDEQPPRSSRSPSNRERGDDE